MATLEEVLREISAEYPGAVIDDGAHDWDPDNLIEALEEGARETDEDSDLAEEVWCIMNEDGSGEIGTYDAQGYQRTLALFNIKPCAEEEEH